MSDRFVVIVQNPGGTRAYGIYRSFRAADREATAVGGYCVPLERKDAEQRWRTPRQAPRA